RDVHLADTQPLCNLRLRHLIEEPHDHDAALAFVQVLHGAIEHIAHLDPVQVGIIAAYRLGERPSAVVNATRGHSVDRHRGQRGAHLHGLQDVVGLHPETFGHLGDCRLPVQLVLHRLVGPNHLLVELLQAAGEAYRPPLVAEVTPDLSQDRGRCEGGELVAHVRVEPVDRLDQTQEAHLDYVLQRLATVLKAPGQEVDEALVATNKLLTDLCPLTPVVGFGVEAMQATQLFAPGRGRNIDLIDPRLRLAQLIRYFTIRYLI